MSPNTPPLRRFVVPALGAAVLGLVLSACTSSDPKMPVYTRSQTGQAIREQGGEILSIRDVVIQDAGLTSQGGNGARIGGAIGIAVITGQTEKIGEVFGSILGERIGGQFDRVPGEEIRIKLDNDEIMTVVQERNNDRLMPGEKVRVQTVSGTAVPPNLAAILGRIGGGAGPVRVVRERDYFASSHP